MQFQADVLGIPVEVAAVQETTALGAAFLAGLAVGVWKTTDELRKKRRVAARYEPKMSADSARACTRGGNAPSDAREAGPRRPGQASGDPGPGTSTRAASRP